MDAPCGESAGQACAGADGSRLDLHGPTTFIGHLFPTPEDDRKAMAEMQARVLG